MTSMGLRALALLLWLVPSATAAAPETLRVAVFTAELDRSGPGLLLRDILKGDPQVAAAASMIAAAEADILLLLRFDYDLGGRALAAFGARLAAAGSPYPHRFALRPNSGRATRLDLDGDGYTRGARDGQGYGRFAGQNGMAILSRLPIAAEAARDFSALPWRALPGAILPRHADGTPFPSEAAQAAQRLFSTAAWDVPVLLPGGGRLHLLAFHATPPVFDGPEDRNGLRNAGELAFWRQLLDGALVDGLNLAPPPDPFVLLGNANNDPLRGEGRNDAIRALLVHPALQDPAPESAGGAAAGRPRATVDWAAEVPDGNLRVDYVLPSATLHVAASGVLWPPPGPEADALLGSDGRAASRHRIVWVDLALPEGALDPTGPRD